VTLPRAAAACHEICAARRSAFGTAETRGHVDESALIPPSRTRPLTPAGSPAREAVRDCPDAGRAPVIAAPSGADQDVRPWAPAAARATIEVRSVPGMRLAFGLGVKRMAERARDR